MRCGPAVEYAGTPLDLPESEDALSAWAPIYENWAHLPTNDTLTILNEPNIPNITPNITHNQTVLCNKYKIRKANTDPLSSYLIASVRWPTIYWKQYDSIQEKCFLRNLLFLCTDDTLHFFILISLADTWYGDESQKVVRSE